MSTIYWKGTATAVAQVAQATFGTYDTGTTRKITIGGVVVQAVDSGGTLTAALSALAVLLNASTHPYFSAITWTSDATHIIGTADTAGVQFVFAGSVSGGTGTCSSAFSATTSNAGPNDWSTADNWSGGAVPVTNDIVILKDNAVNICYGLDQNSVTLTELRIEKSYTGRIGLNRTVFAQSADGATTTTSSAIEYRDTYLKISATLCNIGQNNSPGSPFGSARLMIDFGSNAATVIVHGCDTPSESGRPAVRLKFNENTSALHVRSAPGGVGVAIDTPGETSTLGSINISDVTNTSRVFTGIGTTLTTWTQQGGTNILQAAATVTTLKTNGGTLSVEGDFTITTATVNGGVVYENHIKTSGNAITTLNLNDGVVDALGSTRARTWSTVNLTKGELRRDGSVVTITTPVFPTGRAVVKAS